MLSVLVAHFSQLLKQTTTTNGLIYHPACGCILSILNVVGESFLISTPSADDGKKSNLFKEQIQFILVIQFTNNKHPQQFIATTQPAMRLLLILSQSVLFRAQLGYIPVLLPPLHSSIHYIIRGLSRDRFDESPCISLPQSPTVPAALGCRSPCHLFPV